MVREIGRRTRLTNKDVQKVVEALIEVWTDALIDGDRIEIQNFIVLEVREIDRNTDNGFSAVPSENFRRVFLRTSKSLKKRL